MEKDKDVRFSIDKLTILGKLKKKEYYYLLLDYSKYNIDFKIKYIDNDFFSDSFIITDLGFMQIDCVTLKFRLEFNPNKLTDSSSKLLDKLLYYVTDYHFSRIDLAIDLFNYNLYDYKIVDLGRRKKAYYYDSIGKLETCYFGSLASNKFIRIYNKAVEQKIKDKDLDWWRIELQLRDDYIDTYLTGVKDFLKDIIIFKYVSTENYDVYDKAVLEYILFDIHRLSEFSKNTRTKYKKIINNLELESLDFVNSFMQCSYEKVIDYLKHLCPNVYL